MACEKEGRNDSVNKDGECLIKEMRLEMFKGCMGNCPRCHRDILYDEPNNLLERAFPEVTIFSDN